MREFMIVAGGNELVMGIILASWMLLTAIGALLTKFLPSGLRNYALYYNPLLLSLIALGSVTSLNIFFHDIFTYGVAVGLYEIILLSLVMLAPFCLLGGISFPLLSALYSSSNKQNTVGEVYAWEGIGSIGGGVIFNLLMINFFSSAVVLSVVMLINILFVFYNLQTGQYTAVRILFILICLILPVYLLFISSKYYLREELFPGQEILSVEQTPFGELAVTESNGQVNFYESGQAVYSSRSITRLEERVHFAMLQRPNAKQILMISGGLFGSANEIVKYPDVEEIVLLEPNKYLVKLAKHFIPETDSLFKTSELKVFHKDARIFLNETEKKFDVALINTPDPSTAQFNRYFTIDFFKRLKQHLTNSGLISISLSSTANYMSEESALTNAILYHSLKKIFKHVLLIAGNRNYYLASDGRLDYGFLNNIEKHNIQTDYVNSFYLDSSLLKHQSELIREQLPEQTKPNKDFRPVLYFAEINQWLKHFEYNRWILIGLLALLIIVPVAGNKLVNTALYTGGFTAASIEFILLFSYQIIYGYVYLFLGFIIPVFMGGLALGALRLIKSFGVFNLKIYSRIQLLIGVYAISTPLVLLLLRELVSMELIMHALFLLFTFTGGMLVGLQFAYSTRIQQSGIKPLAAVTYSADMFGSAAGAILTSIILVPLLGIAGSTYVLAGFNFLVALLIYLKHKTLIT